MIDFKKLFGKNEDFIYQLGYESGDYWAMESGGLGKELVDDVSNMFHGTSGNMNTRVVGSNGELVSLSMLNRMALTTAIYFGEGGDYREVMQPITPEVSEHLLKKGQFPVDSKEALALLLYDSRGSNELEACALFHSIMENQEGLGLSDEDMSKRLVVVNAGLEVDTNMPHRVKPIVLPDFTVVYPHETLDFSDKDHTFSYMPDRGLPHFADLGHGVERTLKMPGRASDIGLRVLVREGEDVLNASYGSLIQNEPHARMYIGPRPKVKK